YGRISFFFSSRRRHTRFSRDWSSDVCSSDLFRLEQCVLRPELWTEDALFQPESRAAFRAILNTGYVDAVRATTSAEETYTFWDRSEERRVGKECITRWSRSHCVKHRAACGLG